ncbi:MAG: DUF1294 domain-containing protein [Acutalibacteraceae bacterium]
MIEYYLCYLAVINLATLLIFGIDKLKSVRGKYRISEKTLLILCLLGGALGGLIAMILFNHKTRKAKFFVIVPLLVIVPTALFLLIAS